MNTNEEMLQFLHKSASMSVDSTTRVLEQTRDSKMKKELCSQINTYRRFADDATRELKNHGLVPEDNKLMTKIMSDVGIIANMMIDRTPSHVAELMINGTNMGVIKMNKHLNRNKDIDPKTESLCRELIDFQKKCVCNLEPYLS